MAKDLNRHSTKGDKQGGKYAYEKWSTSYVIKEMKLKQHTTTKQLLTQPKPGTLMTWNTGKDVERRDAHLLLAEMKAKISRFRRPPGSLLQNSTSYHMIHHVPWYLLKEVEKSCLHTTFTQMFTAAVLIVAQKQKESKRPLTEGQINKTVYPHSRVLFHSKEKWNINEVLIHTTTRMKTLKTFRSVKEARRGTVGCHS